MIFTISLYGSLALFFIGSFYRIWTWFNLKIGPDTAQVTFGTRVGAAIKGLLATLFSPKLFVFIKVLILDVILQVHILKDDFLRWLMHMGIYVGFMLLLLMHALENQITQPLFSDYASTLNPFMFLRNLFGVMAVLGVAIAMYRRITVKRLRAVTRGIDQYAVIILAVIMISGFLLEGVKIISASVFDEMVADYADPDETEDVRLLQIYWAAEFGVVFQDLETSNDTEELEQGRELHEESCMDCHSRPVWAFASFPVAKALSPFASILDKVRADTWLWYIHFLACFIGLAYLPFSKFFHIISTPVNLLVKGVAGRKADKPANAATQRAMGLDACTHCGTCSAHCSVTPVFQKMGNPNILPSEKLGAIKKLAQGKILDADQLQAIQEGSFICTGCFKCTEVCPSGIYLQDLWLAAKADLVEKGYADPVAWSKKQSANAYAAKIKDSDTALVPDKTFMGKQMNLSGQADTFSACFECQTCTNVCPVVANFENPGETLDLTPHQIMHSLGLGLKEMVLGSQMIWDCTTCYLCQEHCPQGVQVTDVLYELKNLAYGRLKASDKEKN
jgi:heterodisulfide reductase subunit C/nitrate reductase gamma subunit